MVKRSLPGSVLRALLSRAHEKGSVSMPGSFNGLVARAVANEGFQAAYVSGAGVAAGMGLPDIGLATMDDFTRVIRDVSVCSGLPVLSDADTGFGGVENIPRLVHEYSRAGAAGFHIEDQVFPKRCGHLDGKTLVPAADFALKVRSAATTRDELDKGFIVCARTDARADEGLEGTIERAKRYVDAGADMIFPEGLHTEEEFQKVSEALRGYNGINDGEGPWLLANMTEFGKTPIIPLSKFTELRYHCTIFPMTLLRSAMAGVVSTLRELKSQGFVGPQTCEHMLSRKQTYELLGYTPSGGEWMYPCPTARRTSTRKGRRGRKTK